MACIINADNGAISGSAGVKTTADSTGVLNIQTNGTTAISISASQAVSFTNTPTFTGGTANGVLYLNGSKVATSGSALTFDGTNLAVGASPTFYGAQVATAGSISITGGNLLKLWNTGGTGVGGISSPGTDTIAFGLGASFTEGMRLTSTGLGIGTSSPSNKLNVSGNGYLFALNGGLTNRVAQTFGNTGGGLDLGIEGSAGGTVFTGGSSYAGVIGTNNATALQLGTNGTIRATLDSSGNLGLGVTPSAWSTSGSYAALQIGAVGLYGRAAASNELYLTSNAFNSATGFKYIYTASATRYDQDTGKHIWYNAASGTAGNVITFTQAMTLDASGNLIVGGTSPVISGAGRGNITINGSSTAVMALSVGGSAKGWVYHDNTNLEINAGSAGAMIMYTAGTERARITSGGDLLVGTTSAGFTGRFVTLQPTSASNVMTAWNSATSGDNSLIGFFTDGGTGRGSITYNRAGGLVAYNTTSDYRLKDNIANAADSGDKVDAIKVRQFDWKETGNHVDYGFVAQELHEVAPHAVTKPEDDEAMWSVDYSKLVPMLVKEIQSLRARVAQLETK